MTKLYVSGKREENDRLKKLIEKASKNPKIREALEDKPEGQPVEQEQSLSDSSFDDYLKLENIQCVDAKGKVFEEYPELYIGTAYAKDENGNLLTLKEAKALPHKGFYPSFALTCNIISKLFEMLNHIKQGKKGYENLDYGNAVDIYHKVNTILQTYLQDDVLHEQNTIISYCQDYITHHSEDSKRTLFFDSDKIKESLNSPFSAFSDTYLLRQTWVVQVHFLKI